ncbi:hypothetical protein [Campylobacter sp. LH-2024]|uniref:hypothetical protein n=1 Tax=Campylobacter sp. LH-2024 TaxID=3239825 RepID=UPI003B7B7F0C
MEIFLIWLVFVVLSLFFWAIEKRKGITNDNELPFLVKVCYTVAQFPFGLIAMIFIALGHLFGFILKIIFELLFFVFSKEKKALDELENIKQENEELTKEKMALGKLEDLKKENKELVKKNEELLNKRDLLLKKIDKRHKYE